MPTTNGQIIFILVLALLLSCAAAWVLAWRYRVAMRRLMSAPSAARPATAQAPASAAAGPTVESPAWASFADNRRATWRLTLLLALLSCLMAVSAAVLWLLLSFPAEPFAPKRAAVLALLKLWPLVPVLGLLWRWSMPRLLGAMALFCTVCFAVMTWRSIVPQPAALLFTLALEIGPPLVMLGLIFVAGATRAAAPWLLPVFIGLVCASVLGIQGLNALLEVNSPVARWVVSTFTPTFGIALFALLPWVLAWWPLRRLGRALGRAYARKRLSELMVMFTAVWALELTMDALTVASSAGWRGVTMLLPLLWIPLVMRGNAALLRRQPGRPPTLLVLRVFQHDAQVQRLFDHVVERWRLSGNTVLIAGTDLADRTLDAEDIFTFLDRRLASRFIASADEVEAQLAAFDLARDADGRFRVNECYCHDTTWQDALHALVERSDLVLMDLRGFQAHNAGCRYELATLALARRVRRVVVLTDARTDRTTACECTAGAPTGRFAWLDAAAIGVAKRHEVLAGLFASPADPAPASDRG